MCCFKTSFFKIESNIMFKKDEVKLSHSMEVLKISLSSG